MGTSSVSNMCNNINSCLVKSEVKVDTDVENMNSNNSNNEMKKNLKDSITINKIHAAYLIQKKWRKYKLTKTKNLDITTNHSNISKLSKLSNNKKKEKVIIIDKQGMIIKEDTSSCESLQKEFENEKIKISFLIQVLKKLNIDIFENSETDRSKSINSFLSEFELEDKNLLKINKIRHEEMEYFKGNLLDFLNNNINPSILEREKIMGKYTINKDDLFLISNKMMYFVELSFRNGDSYYAGLVDKNFRKNGYGIYCDNENKYIGSFKSNKFNGKGRMYSINGDFFEGNHFLF